MVGSIGTSAERALEAPEVSKAGAVEAGAPGDVTPSKRFRMQ